MKTCTQCAQSYGDDKQYCLRCGIPLEMCLSGSDISCQYCHISNKHDFNFCKKCGKKLKAAVVTPLESSDLTDQDKKEILPPREPVIRKFEEKPKRAQTISATARLNTPANKIESEAAPTAAKEIETNAKAESIIPSTGITLKATEKPDVAQRLPPPKAPQKVAPHSASTMSQKKSYTKYAIIGALVIALVIAGIFLKSYLNKPMGQVEKEVLQKPQQVQPQQPLEVPKPVEPISPVVELPKDQQPVATGEPPASVNPAAKNQTAPAERSATAGKPIKKETAAKAKRQVAPQPEATKDQLPKKNEKKSFAPHSRDDL